MTYTGLSLDLEEKGYLVVLVPYEVISFGYITSFVNQAKIELMCTMTVFHAYQEKEWVSPPLLSPWPASSCPHSGHPSADVICSATRRWSSSPGTTLQVLGTIVLTCLYSIWSNKGVQPRQQISIFNIIMYFLWNFGAFVKKSILCTFFMLFIFCYNYVIHFIFMYFPIVFCLEVKNGTSMKLSSY